MGSSPRVRRPDSRLTAGAGQVTSRRSGGRTPAGDLSRTQRIAPFPAERHNDSHRKQVSTGSRSLVPASRQALPGRRETTRRSSVGSPEARAVQTWEAFETQPPPTLGSLPNGAMLDSGLTVDHLGRDDALFRATCHLLEKGPRRVQLDELKDDLLVGLATGLVVLEQTQCR